MAQQARESCGRRTQEILIFRRENIVTASTTAIPSYPIPNYTLLPTICVVYPPAMCRAVMPILELGWRKLTPVLANTSNTSACPHLAAEMETWFAWRRCKCFEKQLTQMDWCQTKLVFVVGRHPVEQHELDGLEVAALGGEVERSVLGEPVHGVGHQQLVNLEHSPQHLHRPFLIVKCQLINSL